MSVALAAGVTLIPDRGEHPLGNTLRPWRSRPPARPGLWEASAQVTDETRDDQGNRASWVGSPGWGKQKQLHVAEGGWLKRGRLGGQIVCKDASRDPLAPQAGLVLVRGRLRIWLHSQEV